MTELPAATSICPLSRVSFELEILPHLESLGCLALRLTRNQADANDLVQEAVLRAWRFFHHFRAGSNSRAWLCAILQNNFRNHWRKRELERSVVQFSDHLSIDSEIDSAPLAHAPGPEREVSEHLTGEAIQAALHSLPETFRSALLLVDAQELAYDQAATALRVPIGTVKSRVSRGRAMMRHALKERARLEGLAATRPQQRYSRHSPRTTH
jgi:RNA polymerase sigma-70 factor (ECF subfamily)